MLDAGFYHKDNSRGLRGHIGMTAPLSLTVVCPSQYCIRQWRATLACDWYPYEGKLELDQNVFRQRLDVEGAGGSGANMHIWEDLDANNQR